MFECVLFLLPLTFTTYSIKTTSKPITAKDEAPDGHLNADDAPASISAFIFYLQ